MLLSITCLPSLPASSHNVFLFPGICGVMAACADCYRCEEHGGRLCVAASVMVGGWQSPATGTTLALYQLGSQAAERGGGCSGCLRSDFSEAGPESKIHVQGIFWECVPGRMVWGDAGGAGEGRERSQARCALRQANPSLSLTQKEDLEHQSHLRALPDWWQKDWVFAPLARCSLAESRLEGAETPRSWFSSMCPKGPESSQQELGVGARRDEGGAHKEGVTGLQGMWEGHSVCCFGLGVPRVLCLQGGSRELGTSLSLPHSGLQHVAGPLYTVLAV